MSTTMIIGCIIGAAVAVTLGLLLSRLDRGMHGDTAEQTPPIQDEQEEKKNQKKKKK